MNLSVGIVGLPNVGKSTLFNALLKKQQAYVANYPFATIEPNVGVVPVPDDRLLKLAEVVQKAENLTYLPPQIPATCEFVDIAGLIAGAHKGEGLGNKFLSHIRLVDAICHVVRAFRDPKVVNSGSVDPKNDFEIVRTELDLSDLEMIESHKSKRRSDSGSDVLPLFSQKPSLVVLNIGEEDVKNASLLEDRYSRELGLDRDQVVAICAKTEAELADLSQGEQKEYLRELGIERSGLERLINKAFTTLGLTVFLTAGRKEIRAWTIKMGTKAQDAAGKIHTDFVKKFIRAEVVTFADFVQFGGWKACRNAGKVRSEGKDYVVASDDIIEFKIGT